MRKSGARIKNNLAIKPLGVKSAKYELDARAAMLALERNVFTEHHLMDLFVLANLCGRMSDEKHIKVHAESVKRMIEQFDERQKVERLEYVAIETSAEILLEFFSRQRNVDIARACLRTAK